MMVNFSSPQPLLWSAVNYSEGCRLDVVEAIAEAVRSAPDAILADYSADCDHNRMVASILGNPEAVQQAILASAKVAVEQIDMRTHSGVHPRLGAIDVVPLVPVRDMSREECIALSREIGQAFYKELGVPVYLYEYSAPLGRRSALPEIRKGGFEGLFREPLINERAPDFGDSSPHPTAGAVIIGVRDPLVAYNILLDTPDIVIAQKIARQIRKARETHPELIGVRALGLYLPSQNRAQVSMNLTKPHLTSLPAVFNYVRQEANRLNTQVLESEIIGLIPRSVLAGQPPETILWKDFKETQILEYWC